MKNSMVINYTSVETKVIDRRMQENFDLARNNILTKPKDTDMRINENKYSPKYIVKLLTEKYPSGKAFFYFSGKNDYIALFSNGQLNVRGGEEDMFRAWMNSEFRNLKPQSVFHELEKELIKINFTPVSGRENYSFDSYSDFITWLTDRN
jgi:hypothetical protein